MLRVSAEAQIAPDCVSRYRYLVSRFTVLVPENRCSSRAEAHLVIAAVNPRAASGVSVRIRSWPLLFVTVLFFAFTSATPAQPVEPEGSLPRPPFPVRNGAVPARKSGGETSPSTSGLVTSMKLLAPDVGWAMSMGRLMWTSSGGTDWKDITPPGPEGAVTSAISFSTPVTVGYYSRTENLMSPAGCSSTWPPLTTRGPVGRWSP